MHTAILRRALATVSQELASIRRQHPHNAAELDAHTDARIALLALLAYAQRLDLAAMPQRDHPSASAAMRRLIGDPAR